MTQTEYLETREGQSHERLKRISKTIYLVINQEPKGKNSSNQEKLSFRQEVKRQLTESGRRPFKGDIMLEIDFYTTQNNPPALHTLSKNYLDLLHKSMPQIDANNRILFKDDAQIKILISNYHLDEYGNREPQIRISAYNLDNFYKDVELTDRILNNRFDDGDSFRHSRFEKDFKQDFYHNSNSDYTYKLNELEKKKDVYINKFGEQLYCIQRQFYISQIQEQYLKQNYFGIRNIISLFQSNFSYYKKYADDKRFQTIWDSSRNLIFFSSNFVEFGEAPIHEGEKIIFKKNLQNKLRKFKEKYKILFPLLQPISVIITFIPPKHNVVDLDNLARYIVPFVNEILEPPSTLLLSYDRKYLNELLKKEVDIAQRFPPNSISSYQLIHIPRLKKDPENGKIGFIITDGLHIESSIWRTVDNTIYKWDKRI